MLDEVSRAYGVGAWLSPRTSNGMDRAKALELTAAVQRGSTMTIFGAGSVVLGCLAFAMETIEGR